MVDNGTACLISALRFRIHIQTIASTIPILQVESNHAIRPILCRLTGGAAAINLHPSGWACTGRVPVAAVGAVGIGPHETAWISG